MTEPTPDTALQLYRAGLALHQQGQVGQALSLYRRSLLADPGLAACLHLLGVAHYQSGRPDEAVTLIRHAIACDPRPAEFHGNLAPALLDLDHLDASFHHGRLALVANPGKAMNYVNVGAACRNLGRLEEAERHGRRASKIDPAYSPALNNLGLTLRQRGRTDDAMAALRLSMILAPDNAKAEQNLGLCLMDLGRPEAITHYARSLIIAPNTLKYLRNLSELHRFQVDDPWLRQLRQLEPRLESLPPTQRIDLHFALAKALDDIGDKPSAFDHLLAGNSLKRREVVYDEPAMLTLFETIRAKFTAERLVQTHGGNCSSRPIFIVGLPRSGTTLIEQILASHPLVFGAGELTTFSDALTMANHGSFPDLVDDLTPADLHALGGDYLKNLPETGEKFRHVTDKMPGNLIYAGMIHMALPNARIILLRRDPVDVCLSCFSKQFSGDLNFTYDLSELGRYARASLSLMDHWEQVLPHHALLTVDYEKVVDDLEGQARRLLDFCGLPWNDKVMSFHKTERAVRTASANQVRRPIYNSAVGRWRPSPVLLAPLLDGLGR